MKTIHVQHFKENVTKNYRNPTKWPDCVSKESCKHCTGTVKCAELVYSFMKKNLKGMFVVAMRFARKEGSEIIKNAFVSSQDKPE